MLWFDTPITPSVGTNCLYNPNFNSVSEGGTKGWGVKARWLTNTGISSLFTNDTEAIARGYTVQDKVPNLVGGYSDITEDVLWGLASEGLTVVSDTTWAAGEKALVYRDIDSTVSGNSTFPGSFSLPYGITHKEMIYMWSYTNWTVNFDWKQHNSTSRDRVFVRFSGFNNSVAGIGNAGFDLPEQVSSGTDVHMNYNETFDFDPTGTYSESISSPWPLMMTIVVHGSSWSSAQEALIRIRQGISLTLNSYDPPSSSIHANWTATPPWGYAPLSVNFFDQSLEVDISHAPHYGTSWAWDFGDPGSGGANTSTLQNPSHTFSAPGHYPVTLSVVFDTGHTASITLDYNAGATPGPAPPPSPSGSPFNFGITWPDNADIANSFSNTFNVANDTGYPALFFAPATTVGSDPAYPATSPDVDGNVWLDNKPDRPTADTLAAYDISSSSPALMQTFDTSLLPTAAETPHLGVPTGPVDVIDVTFVEDFNSLQGIAVSLVYDDPLLSGTPVYLVNVGWSYGGSNPIVSGFYRIPSDLSGPFDYLDGIRALGYSFIQTPNTLTPTFQYFNYYKRFWSDNKGVWVPGGWHLDRECTAAWSTYDITIPGYGAVKAFTVPSVWDGADYIYSIQYISSGPGYQLIRTHICRNCYSCYCPFVSTRVAIFPNGDVKINQGDLQYVLVQTNGEVVLGPAVPEDFRLLVANSDGTVNLV